MDGLYIVPWFLCVEDEVLCVAILAIDAVALCSYTSYMIDIACVSVDVNKLAVDDTV